METKKSTYSKFINLAKLTGLSAIDIGARGGINNDLSALARGIDYYGFEPDPEECTKLNMRKPGPWKSLTFIATALDEKNGNFDLNLYSRRGCSSGLSADQDLAKLFSREDYYIHDGVINVPSKKLDDVIEEHQITAPSFVKIDVQGMELDVFKGANSALLNSLVGIRTEVGFFPLYEHQPLFADIDQYLRQFGFYPMQWIELHEWRRTTKRKLPYLGTSKMPYSKGQLAHGDVLYLLSPESLPRVTDHQIKRLIRLALISICYGHLDHALAVFRIPEVNSFVIDMLGYKPIPLLEKLSRSHSFKYRGIGGMVKIICKKIDRSF